MKVAFSCDDVALKDWSTPKDLDTLIKYYDKNDIKATFFVVPVNEDGTDFRAETEYIAILKDAIKNGHAVGQHGITHYRFEIGIPPQMILDLPNEVESKRRVAEEYDLLVKELTLDKIRTKLRMGKNILEEALGIEIDGFRSPSLQVCENLFLALDLEGYKWDSSAHLQSAGWDILNGKENIVFEEFKIDPVWTSHKNYKTYPLTTDYTWFLKQEAYDITLELAKFDIKRCKEIGLPYVPVTHVSPINLCDNGLGYKIYDDILSHLKDNYDFEIATLKTL